MRKRATFTLVIVAIGLVAMIFWLRSAVDHGDPGGREPRRTDPRSPATAPADLQDPRPSVERLEPSSKENDRSSRAAPTVDPSRAAPSVIRGRVLDSTTALPLAAFEVLCSPQGAEQNSVDTILGMESSTGFASSSFVDASGRFEIAVRGTEPQSVCAFARGYARSEPVTGMPGDDLEIRLEPAGTVRGTVVDPSTGNPVGGALVGWLDRHGQARTGPLERFERTDALGRFELGSVPFSARNVVAGREDLGDGVSKGLDLAPDHAEREVVIELRRSGG